MNSSPANKVRSCIEKVAEELRARPEHIVGHPCPYGDQLCALESNRRLLQAYQACFQS